MILSIRTSIFPPSSCSQTAGQSRETNSCWTAVELVFTYHFTGSLASFMKQDLKHCFKNRGTKSQYCIRKKLTDRGYCSCRTNYLNLFGLNFYFVKHFLSLALCLVLFSHVQHKWCCVHCDPEVSSSVTAFQKTDPLFFLTALLDLVLYVHS